MYKVTQKKYASMLKIHDDSKTPLYVYGAPGVGKSEIPRQVFAEVANKEGRIFREWNDMTMEEKEDSYQNPSKYFIFTDFRLVQCDTTDLRGVINLSNQEMLEYLPLAWVLYYTKPEARGVIFFDELNLAPQIVAGQAYQIINDRVISDRRISDGVFILGAGNRASDGAYIFTMPFPLRDRFSELEIEISMDDWVTWASNANINPYLITFVKWKRDVLYAPATNTEDKGSTPRGIVRASKMIEFAKVDIFDPLVFELTSCAVGEAFAAEFMAYTECAAQLDIRAFMKNPEEIREINSPDKLYALCGIIVDRIKNLKPKHKDIEPLLAIVHQMKPEYRIITLSLIKGVRKTEYSFKQLLASYSKFDELFLSIEKYLF